MSYLIIEGDPGRLESLLEELCDRNYLDSEVNAILADDLTELEPFKVLKALVKAIGDEDRPAFREPILTPDELELLEEAEECLRFDPVRRNRHADRQSGPK